MRDTPFMQLGTEDGRLGLDPKPKGPVFGDPCFARAFSEGERAKEVGKGCGIGGSIWPMVADLEVSQGGHWTLDAGYWNLWTLEA